MPGFIRLQRGHLRQPVPVRARYHLSVVDGRASTTLRAVRRTVGFVIACRPRRLADAARFQPAGNGPYAARASPGREGPSRARGPHDEPDDPPCGEALPRDRTRLASLPSTALAHPSRRGLLRVRPAAIDGEARREHHHSGERPNAPRQAPLPVPYRRHYGDASRGQPLARGRADLAVVSHWTSCRSSPSDTAVHLRSG